MERCPLVEGLEHHAQSVGVTVREPVSGLATGDVTERTRAEESLLKAEGVQNAIFNSANFSSIATDEKGVIQIFNVGAERMLGYWPPK